MRFRVAIFGSHYYGLAMLETLLSLQQRFPHEIEIVGVATDDPTKYWVNPDKRLWQYPHTKQEEEMVANLASQNGIPVWRGRVKTEEFNVQFKEWMPDICYMGVFGQRIPKAIFSAPLYGFYNFHSCAGEKWPSNTGAQAFESMAGEGKRQIATAMHAVDEEFDHGPLVAFSQFLPFLQNEEVMETFKRTRSLVAGLVGWHIGEILRLPVVEVAKHVAEMFEIPTKQAMPRIIVDEQMSAIRGDVGLSTEFGSNVQMRDKIAILHG